MVYIDGDYRAHAAQNAEQTRVPWADTHGVFTGKCETYIAGYRIIPAGETWTREDGATFAGPMIAPAVNPAALQAAQAEADGQTITALDAAVVELTYQNILLELGV